MRQASYKYRYNGVRLRSQTDRAAEKRRRGNRRLLTLVLMTNHNSGNVANDLVAELRRVQEIRDADQVAGRIRTELITLKDSIGQMLWSSKIRDQNRRGWDATRYRPLQASCSISRRGVEGPDTPGCFVTIGPDEFILSNTQVLRQPGTMMPTIP